MNEAESIEVLCRELAAAGVPCRRGEPMSGHTTWRIGGPADVLVEPESRAQLLAGLEAARRAGVPAAVIGRGSNLLFADEGFRGAVFQVGRKMDAIAVDGRRIAAEAGALACRVALAACRHGLAGLEHTAGIPGTIGGLLAMNGGSQQRCVGESVEWVEACGDGGEIRRLDRAACGFAYRDSLFLHEPGLTIVCVSLALADGTRADIRRTMLGYLKERRGKFPRKAPSCGSVFKSSPELYALAGPPGRIIESLGFKGRRAGGAEVSPQHANFIVNTGGARAADVLALIRAIREAVHARHGLWMETEARYVRPHGGMVPAHEAAGAERRAPSGVEA